MFNKLAIEITNYMETTNTIQSEEREIYLFGIKQVLFMLLGFFTMLLIGLLFRAFFYTVIFASAFIPLRSFAGGYHAQTQLRCYFASIAMTVFVAVMYLEVSLSNSVMVVLLLVFGTLIIALSPIGSANKPLDNLEKRVYKRKTLQICIAEIFIALVFILLRIQFITVGIFWALMMILVLQILEKLIGKKA